MSAPPRFLSPFVRTRARLTLTLGLLLAALTTALLPWWHPEDASPPPARETTDARQADAAPRDEVAAMAEARRTGKEVVVETATTATSMTWARPDGQVRTQTAALPQRAKNAEGAWAPIDNRLRRTDDGDRGLGIQPVNPAAPVRFASGTSGDSTSGGTRADRSYARRPLTAEDTVLAELDIDGHTIAYTWPGPLPEPVLDGPRALYSEVLPGVDLLMVAREEGGFAQLLIVKSREAAQSEALATVSYGLRSQTAVFRYDETASRVMVLDPAGTEIGSVPTPFGWDSSGRDPELPEGETEPRTSVATPADVLRLSGLSGIEPGAHSAPLPVQVQGDGTGAARLDLRVSETGLLTDENARFPVFVDPTFTTGWLHWTVAYKPYPNTSFWDGTNFNTGTSDARVGYESDTGGTARSFWRMAMDKTWQGAVVSDATFKVLNNHSWSCTAREFQFWLTGGISTGTTWNSQPVWAEEASVRHSFAHGWSSTSCPDTYEAFKVKASVQKGVTAGWTNITFGMRATSETDTQTWRKFRATSAVLEVVLNRTPEVPSDVKSTPGGTCNQSTSGAIIATTSVNLSATSTDDDGNLEKLQFRFWKSGGTQTIYDATPNSGGGASQTVPVVLEDKATYYWEVRAKDFGNLYSAYYPTSGNRCTLTVDTSAPSAPTVTSTVFPPASDKGDSWATVKFGETGAVTFKSDAGEVKRFTYSIEGFNGGEVTADGSGVGKVDNLKPPHAGPNWLSVYAYDAVGNMSKPALYNFYVPPRDTADSPGDTGGDAMPDLLIVNGDGNLANCVGGPGGELHSCLAGSYTSDTSGTKLHPADHWYNPGTGKAALITHYQDAYPGDGSTDLFAVTPDGNFWLYPGDGYGSFDVGKRQRVRLPSNAPAPSTWTQIKAVGDITGDKYPDVVLRAGTAFWVLSGYTGGEFRTATLMNGDAWARGEIVNVADINGDSTPDLLWRNLDSGAMYVRHGRPGTVSGSVDLNSLKSSADSLNGDVSYGTGWTQSYVSAVIGIPDVNGDGIPDMWARYGGDGQMRVYYPSRTNTNPAAKTVLTVDWSTVKSFG